MNRLPAQSTPRIGTAGWSIPREHAAPFPTPGSHLERYAAVLTCAEINSSFYRPHQPATYARWAASTPDTFRFAVKLPKSITHESALAPSRQQLQTFLDQTSQLAHKLGPILVQLPPRQGFDTPTAKAFLGLFRDLYPTGLIALEPRHPAWFSPGADDLLQHFQIARVLADPLPTPLAATPGGYPGLLYHRLHGSPRVYYSSYSPAQLEALALRLRSQLSASQVWCIFDNTASGAAIQNALTLARIIEPASI